MRKRGFDPLRAFRGWITQPHYFATILPLTANKSHAFVHQDRERAETGELT